MTFVRRHWSAILAAISGAVFAASTPPIDFQPGILLGLVGFSLALLAATNTSVHERTLDELERMGLAGPATLVERHVRTGAWRGFLFGLMANFGALRFVPEVVQRFTPLPAVAGWLALVLLSAAQALPWMVGGALARWLVRPPPGSRRPSAPAWLAFAIGVYAATFLPAIFPWTPAGGLARWPVLLQTAELVGERGTSFLVALASGLLGQSVHAILREAPDARARLRLAARDFALGGVTFLVLIAYGSIRVRIVDAQRDAAPHARVALLQPDFDALFRWEEQRSATMMDRLSALTKHAEQAGAILTVWPESAYPYTLAHGTKRSPLGARALLQQGVRGPVLTGAYMSKGGGLGTNSAILVSPSGDIGPSYDKRHLLWFGETVPLADTFPILRQIFARGTGLAPGTESVPFTSGPIVAAVLNCYEDTLPSAGREALEVRPNLLVNVTNDAWFTGSAEGELHLRLAVLRAVETRRDLVRAVNRGPTTWVDATGRIRARSDSSPGLGPSPPLLADAALLDAPLTPYARAGDVPLVMLVLASIVVPWARRQAPRVVTRRPTDGAA